MKYLTFALAKGRLGEQTVKLLNKSGVKCDADEKSRQLVFINEEQKYRFFLAKSDDVPTYVEYGAADVGIAGKDTLLEENRDLYEVCDLGFGQCSLVVAGREEFRDKYGKVRNLRVSTKYTNLTKIFFNDVRRKTVEIIKLNGSMELGPIVGLSDVVVDITQTGSTLRQNGLVILDTICETTARLVVNRVSMKMENERINELIGRIKENVNGSDTEG